MSKELEALKRITNSISVYKLHGFGDKNWLGLQDTMKDIDTLEEALTPPTEQEICEALSEWFVDDDFYYDVNQKEFYTKALNGQHSVVKLKNNEIHFGGWFTMPPHLITMIGRFYERLEEEKDERK